jgi:hypothetical protein
MFAPFNLSNAWRDSSNSKKQRKPRDWQSLWDKLKDWLMEPIDFPGKLPERGSQQKGYNLKERTDTDIPRD